MSDTNHPQGSHGPDDMRPHDDYDEGFEEHYDEYDAQGAHESGLDEEEGRRKLAAPLVLVGTIALLLLGLFGALTTLRGTPDEQDAAGHTPTPATSSGSIAAGPVVPATPSTTATTSATTATTTPTTAATTGADSPTVADPSDEPSPTATDPAIAATPPTATRTTDAATDAGAELARIAASDSGRRPASSAVSAYLQTRSPGQVDNFMTGPVSGSNTWTSADILAYHQQLKSKFPAVVLFKGNSGKWVSAVSVPGWQSTADAKIWCQRTYSQFGEYIPTNYALRDRCDVP